MSDLISRAAAIERATKDHDFYKGATTPADKARRDELLNVMCWLGDLPSAQPEIIRCGDCVYKPCKMMPYSYDDDFCSYAERKTDGI